MAKSVKKNGRGRPVVYKGKKLLRHFATLVRNNGATGARNILNAEAGTELAKERSANLVPKALGISLPTLLKIAKAEGVVLKRGRRNGSKAA